jgi:hypothetical protein
LNIEYLLPNDLQITGVLRHSKLAYVIVSSQVERRNGRN